jgi:lysophospholipase L1-like esterase
VNGILKKAILTVVGLPLVVEGVQWAAMRTPKNLPLVISLRQDYPGFAKEATLRIDKDLSLRGPDWTVPKEGTVRILLLGGESTVAYRQSQDNTWWGKLQAALAKKYPNRKVEFASNATDPGISLRGAKWLSEVAPMVKPDAVIACIGAGDVFSQPQKYTYKPNRLANMASTLPTRGALKNFFLSFSQTARRSRVSALETESLRIARNMEENGPVFVEKSRREFAKLQNQQVPASEVFRLSENDPAKEYLDALQSLQETASQTGAKLILLGEPMLLYRELSMVDEAATKVLSRTLNTEDMGGSSFRIQSGWYVSELRRFQEKAQEWADKAKVPFANLNTKVPQDAEHFDGELLLNDKGAEALAEAAYPVVEPVLAPLLK